jgi:hypothetical protein
MGGLFAPFGFILASGNFAMILFPTDLGAYLLASNNGGSVQLSDAVVAGISPYFRMKDLPLGFGGSVEYSPSFGSSGSRAVSVFAWAGLDLPMYMVK